MQFRLLSALIVFLGSYFPLALILALQDVKEESWSAGICWSLKDCKLPSNDHPYLSSVVVVVTFVCLLVTIRILSRLRCKYPVRVNSSKPVSSELISYSFPYIVSFMGVDYGSAGKIAGLAVFLMWLFLITYRAGFIIMNPILLILGWDLYEAEVDIGNHKRVIKLLSKKSPVPGVYLCQQVQGNYISKGERQA